MNRGGRRRGVAAAIAGLPVAGAVLAASAAYLGGVSAVPAAATSSAAPGICTAYSPAHRALAAKLSRDINAALASRSSTVALMVRDRRTNVTCGLRQGWHFDSASVVKVTILGGMLRMALDQHRYLTQTEVNLSTAMIERSDNSAASALWNRVGRNRLQHFLNLAKMTHTGLGPDGYWGLTQITAADELTLLKLLTSKNSVLDTPSRRYALNLMAHVISSQRWGVPAGTPKGVTVHVKNGWLPRTTHGWRIHSIGSFSGGGRDYMIVVLTQDNATMAYGVRTIENVARIIHRDLNSGQAAAIPPSVITPSQEVPDESIPALPNLP
ncbi:MAG: serine hydrolase [Micromonosporaceae bacterium]